MRTNIDSLPTTEEIQKIFRLIHELCELGEDAYAWRARMLSELREMVDADAMDIYMLKFPFDVNDIGPTLLLKLHQRTDDSWHDYVEAGDLSGDPAAPHMMQRMGTDFTFARQEIIKDEDWYASDFYRNIARAANWDQIIYSQVMISPPGVIHGLGIGRAVGKPAFGEREVAIVKFLHGELARLWRRPDPVGVNELPPRQREVLNGIRRGESRKEIAEKMGVTDHTVHSYEKTLFEKAGVSSRGALLARLAKLIRPALLPLIFLSALLGGGRHGHASTIRVRPGIGLRGRVGIS